MNQDRRKTKSQLLDELKALHQRIQEFQRLETERKQSEEEGEILRRLAQRLTAPLSLKAIGRIISEESRKLFHHDAFSLSYYDKVHGKSIGVYCEDLPLEGTRPVEVAPIDLSSENFKQSRAYAGKSTLINRDRDNGSPTLIPIGESSRRSESLLFVPIQWSGATIGVLTVQSYTSGKYSKRDRALLETFASQCGGALWRALTEERLWLLGHALEGISEMVTITDLENRFIFVNSAFCKKFGYNRDEVLGRHVSMLWSPNNPEELLEQILQQTRRGGCVVQVLNRNQAGEEFPVELRTSLLKNDEGEIIGFIGISNDVSERIRAEKRNTTYADLGQHLSRVTSPQQAAKIIVRAADEILGWDACFLIRYSEKDNAVSPILAMDLIEGKREECIGSLSSGPPGPFIQKVIQEGRQLALRSAESSDQHARRFGDSDRRSASLMFVPVCQEGRMVAVLSIQSYTPNAYTPENLETLQSLANYCGGALERIQVEADLRSSEERGAAFATLAHRLNSVRTAKEAGHIIADTADQILGFDACFIDLYSPENDMTYHVLNIDTVQGEKVEYPETHPWKITPMKRRVLDTGAFLILRDCPKMEQPEEKGKPLTFGDQSRPSASLMYVPVRKGEKVVGIISIQSYTPQAYTEEDLAVLQDLADHCGGALERIRVEQQVVKERRRIELFAELGRELSAASTPREAGSSILKVAKELIGWDACYLVLYSEERDDVTPVYCMDLIEGKNIEVNAKQFEGTPSAKGYARRVITQGKLLITRTLEEVRTTDTVPFGDTSRRAATLMFVPIVSGNCTIGVLSIQSYTPHAYTQEDLDLLESLAQHCSGALERIRVEQERRNLETQVQQAQKLESLGVLAGGIAHDFNNLLMAILGNADLALRDLSPVSPARENIVEIERASRRAADLCKQMLAYSGKGRFIVQAVNLNEIVEEMGHLLDVSISKKAVLKYHFADALPAVEVDVTQVRQIVMNLITNASEAIGDCSGVISVSTGAMECDLAYLGETYLADDLVEGVYVYIEVADTGCGMDAETLQNIFDPFFTTKFTGRGLGLAAVLGIVRGHRGALKVYSEPERGTTFKVLFPTVDQAVQSIAGKPAEMDDWKGQGTVLLVDDEASVRVVGKQMLERAGFQVLLAVHGREAIEVYQQHQDEIVCVLLDLTMPTMDGEETFRELHRIRRDARVILCSGYSEQEVTHRFSGKGLAGFIQKPYRMIDLVSKLREVLERA